MNDRLKILKNIAILISGTGSNMEAIINDTLSNDHPGIVKFVLSNRSDALGLLKAKKLGMKTFVFPVNRTNSLENFEKKLLKLLIKEKIDLLCLAGFMKILSKNFLESYKRTILNIHPSILPSIKGLNTHQRILEKDINEMIMSGRTKEEIKNIIEKNTYQGNMALLKFTNWRKINV